MTNFDSIRFRLKIFESLTISFGFVSVMCLIFLGIYPVGDQVLFWLKHDIWLEKDLITYLRYLDISPYTDMKGLNRIISWIVSTHIFVFSLILTLVFIFLCGHFAGVSAKLEMMITVGSESENGDITPKYIEEGIKNVPSYGLDKIYPVLRWVRDLPIWSPLDKVWFYFSSIIIWGFLVFGLFIVVYVWVFEPFLEG